jgi:hypothetical protein
VRREHLARVEKARVDHLLGQALVLQQAGQIREYVKSIQALNAQAPDPMTTEELEDWSDWALAQADRIDPVVSGAYRTRPPSRSNNMGSPTSRALHLVFLAPSPLSSGQSKR